MSCKDCQCSKSADQTLVEATNNLDVSDKKEAECTCPSCNARAIPATSGCSNCRPQPQPQRRRNCRCCACRSCCDCCSCCSSGNFLCSALTGKKEEVAESGCKSCAAKKEVVKPKVLESCKCCEAKEEVKPKAVCANCGCDKCS